MSRPASTVLTIRVPRDVSRRLSQEARRRRRTRSELARAFVEEGLSSSTDDPGAEARRQSRLASAHASEREALKFLQDFADLKGWE